MQLFFKKIIRTKICIHEVYLFLEKKRGAKMPIPFCTDPSVFFPTGSNK
jgi:hypothetical protein